MAKKLVVILLLISLSISLCACRSNPDGAAGAVDESESSEPLTPEEIKINEINEYLNGVSYLDFELTGSGEPYYMGRWFEKSLRGVSYMATLTDGSLLYFFIDGAKSFDVEFYVNKHKD